MTLTWPAKPGDEVKVVLPLVHRAGWCELISVDERRDEYTVATPDGMLTVGARNVDGWRPAGE